MKRAEVIGLEAARKRLGSLADDARSGTRVVLTRSGEPVAALVSVADLEALQRRPLRRK